MSVRYIPMRGAGRHEPDGVRCLGIDERGYAALPVRNRLRLIPIRARRCGWHRRGRTAVLGGAVRPRWLARSFAAPARWFSGLLAGSYRLLWSGGGNVRETEVVVGGEELVRLDLGRLRLMKAIVGRLSDLGLRSS